MKKIVLLFSFAFIGFFGFSQTVKPEGAKSNKEFNVPPGSVLHPKTNTNIDYSYKLNNLPVSVSDDVIYDDFLKDYSEEDLQIVEEKEPELFVYLMKAKKYHEALSHKVKATFTFDELWYIYMFDQNLKTELTKIR